MYFPAPSLLLGPRPWPPICIYQPWPPMCVDQPWPKIIHLPALVPKVYLLSQTLAIAPSLYLPVQVKILLLPQLLVPLISLSLAPPPPLLLLLLLLMLLVLLLILLLLLLLLMIIIATKNAFAAAKSALNGP